MRLFFALLKKYSFFLFFLFLELVSLLLVFNYNRYHSSIILNATNDFSSAIVKTGNIFSDYFLLRQHNENLAAENARLHNIKPGSVMYSDTCFYFSDTVYRYTQAKVVDNSVNLKKNYFTINKGSKHGIEKDMGVLSTTGIAGIVVGVSVNYSIVMSLLHTDCQISGLIKKNHQVASVAWNGLNPSTGMLNDIPAHLEINKGDTIISSGYSQIFPAGLLIGFIEEYHANINNNLNTASIRFVTNFGTLEHVYVIENLSRRELETLMKNVENE